MRRELFDTKKHHSDIEYVQKALELRKAVLEQDGVDCFVGRSHTLTPTADDYSKAERVANVLQDCLDSCNGDNGQFIALLQSKMADTIVPPRR